MRVAEELNEGVVVTIFCDSAAKYLSESFWRESLDTRGGELAVTSTTNTAAGIAAGVAPAD